MSGEQTEIEFDVCRNRHRGNLLSEAANRETDKSRDTARILACLASVGDATGDEIAVALDMPSQTCSARVSELKRAGVLEPLGRRPTRTGSMAQVWRLKAV